MVVVIDCLLLEPYRLGCEYHCFLPRLTANPLEVSCGDERGHTVAQTPVDQQAILSQHATSSLSNNIIPCAVKHI